MKDDVIITCAVTGSADTADKHPNLPITPKQIADSSIEAAKAGAAVVHLHVRDPETGAPSRDANLFKEVVDRIRSSNTDVLINLTAGMGGDLFMGGYDDPAKFDLQNTDLASAEDRLIHIKENKPDICTLDCGSMNFGNGDYVMVNTPPMLREMARLIAKMDVMPEVEVFDTGHLWLAKQLMSEKLINPDHALFQLCLGIPYGAPANTTIMKAMVDELPAGSKWAGFGISRMQMPMVAQAVLLGGNVRVGLEDNLYLEKGVFASNAQLVEKATKIINLMGANVANTAQAKQMLSL